MQIYFKWLQVSISLKHLFQRTWTYKVCRRLKWHIIYFLWILKQYLQKKERERGSARGREWEAYCWLLWATWCLDRLTLHSFVPELCVNLSFRKKGTDRPVLLGQKLCAKLTACANIGTRLFTIAWNQVGSPANPPDEAKKRAAKASSASFSKCI